MKKKYLLNNKKLIPTETPTTIYLLVLALLIDVSFYLRSPFELQHEWQVNELSFNYSYGFIKRGFVGSIVKLISSIFNIDYVTAIIIVQFVGELVFATLLFGFIIYAVKKINNKKANFIILLFFSFHIIGAYCFDWGEPDIYLISITVLMCLILLHNRFLCTIPILSAVCVMIHEGYPLMYFGIPMALLFYKTFEEKDNKKRIYKGILFFVTGFTVSGLFIYFYFFSNNYVKCSSEAFISYVKNTIGEFYTQDRNILYILFDYEKGPYHAMWIDGKPTAHFGYRLIAVFMNLAVCLPFLSLLFRFWKNVISYSESIEKKIVYVLSNSFSLLIVPLLFFQTDEVRWFYDFVFFEFFLIVSMLLFGDENLRAALNTTIVSGKKKYYYLLYYCVFAFPDKEFISLIYTYILYLIFGSQIFAH